MVETHGVRDDWAKRTVFEAIALLKQFGKAVGHQQPLLDGRELESLLSSTQAAAHLDPRPRVALMGELKAGKSSLVNSLLGGDYAAVDVLEMTSWIAWYLSSPSRTARVIYKNETSFEVPADEFVRMCRDRVFSKEELNAIDRVEVGTGQCDLPFSLLDCPGSGSVTRENEQRTLEALKDCDFVLWVTSVDDLGSMRQEALAAKLASQGVPSAVVLSKADLLDSDDEAEEIIQYVVRRLDTPRERVFVTNINGKSMPSGQGSGIEKLRRFLCDDVAVRNAEYRQRAQRAHLVRAAELSDHLLERLEADLEQAVSAVSEYAAIMRKIGHAVETETELLIEQKVRDRMFEGHRDQLVTSLGDGMRGKSGLSPESIQAVFESVLGDKYLDDFWAEVVSITSGDVVRSWRERLAEAEAELESLRAEFESQALEHMGEHMNLASIRGQVEATAQNTFANIAQQGVAVAALATAYVAWLGPAAASVTIGAAATGVGLPIALVSLGVASAVAYVRKRDLGRAVKEQVEAVLDEYVEGFLANVVRPHLLPALAAMNKEVELQVVSAFSRAANARLPEGDPEVHLARVQEARSRLAHLLTSGQPI